ncbi:MAG: hypothetical protein JNG83_00010 [Opitutaceae bacterium]|nr:hypothetical protein [Opitutaceae bacterium]
MIRRPRPSLLSISTSPGLCALLLGLVLLPAAAPAFARVEPVPASARAEASPVFRLRADGQPVFAEKFKDMHYAWFSFSGRAAIEVEVNGPIQSFAVSPRAAAIPARAEGSVLRLELDRPRQLVITVNGERLFVFADALDESAPRPGAPGVTSVGDLGIDATGATLETARLQAAIDRVAAERGTLYFPPGVYLTGTLELKSNLTLYLAGGALLLGSTNAEDYPVDGGDDSWRPAFDPVTWTTPQGVDVVGSRTMAYRRLIFVNGATNVRVAGRGTIDGRGKLARTTTSRPMLVHIRSSAHVVFEGVTLRDPAMFNTHILDSDHVTYRGVKLLNDTTVPNTDGFDPDGSADILAEDCFMIGSDDTIAIKSSGQGGLLRDAERITVRRCVFITRTSAMKLGTESHAPYHRDITFEDIDVVEADRAINLSCMDGSRYENIRFINIRVENILARTPHSRVISAQVRKRFPHSRVGRMRDILVQDFSVAQELPHPLRFLGLAEGQDIRGLRFVNYSVAGRVRLDAADAGLATNGFVSGVEFSR